MNLFTLNRVFAGIYAASTAVITLLVDQSVITAHTGADIGVIIAAFAAGFHGSQLIPAAPVKPPDTPAA